MNSTLPTDELVKADDTTEGMFTMASRRWPGIWCRALSDYFEVPANILSDGGFLEIRDV